MASLRLARTTGILASNTLGLTSTTAGATLEAAYIRFAGFTFGAARDNFAFMPSTFYGAGHWASFANGAKQLAYTAVLGGGLSATVAIQDLTDTTAGGVNAAGYIDPITGLYVAPGAPGTFATTAAGVYSYNSLPQINARLDWDQGWGSVSVMGAVGRAVNTTPVGSNTAVVNGAAIGTLDLSNEKTVWAIGAGAKINLPMIAAGDVLYLNGAYANGMTEYTINWLYFKSSDTRRNTGGFVQDAPSWVNSVDAAGNAQIQTLKSWNLAAIYTHYWAPEWRHSLLGSYGRVEGTNLTSAIAFGTGGGFGDATVWNIGTQLAWLPTRNFEIGVDILYNRVAQDVRRTLQTGTAGTFCTAAGVGCTTRESEGNWTGRLRVERTF